VAIFNLFLQQTLHQLQQTYIHITHHHLSPLSSYQTIHQITSQSIRARRRQVKVASRVVIRVNLEKAEAIHRHGHLVASRVNQVDTQVTHGAAESQERAVVDQERVGRAEDGVQVHLVVIHTSLAMEEDIQMEEDTIQDTIIMEVIQVAQVGHLVANLERAAADHLGHLAVRAASLEAIHHLLHQAHGIHLEVVTPNHRIPNLPTVVVPKMMGTGTLVATEANGTRAHRGHLAVASRGRAEEALAHRGAHRRRVNLASLDTEIC